MEIEEDAAESDARIRSKQEEERRKEMARRSQAVQKGLPRPARIDVGKLLEQLSLTDGGEDDYAAADRLCKWPAGKACTLERHQAFDS